MLCWHTGASTNIFRFTRFCPTDDSSAQNCLRLFARRLARWHVEMLWQVYRRQSVGVGLLSLDLQYRTVCNNAAVRQQPSVGERVSKRNRKTHFFGQRRTAPGVAVAFLWSWRPPRYKDVKSCLFLLGSSGLRCRKQAAATFGVLSSAAFVWSSYISARRRRVSNGWPTRAFTANPVRLTRRRFFAIILNLDALARVAPQMRTRCRWA